MRRPSYRPTITFPGRATEIFETHPIKREVGLEAYCKYCYRTHRNWWLMPEQADTAIAGNGDTRELLCGYCEHISLACLMKIKVYNPLRTGV